MPDGDGNAMTKGLCKAHIYGVVQGVGFRPTVHRVATGLGLTGYVRNRGSFVEVAIDGSKKELDKLIKGLKASLPPLARLDRVDIVCDVKLEEGDPDLSGLAGFVIVPSKPGTREGIIPPDTAICKECLEEVLREEENRRYLYPFTNCTNCGARFSVISDMPYDRENTAMKEFEMCVDCKAEYANPSNRRFHAQTLSCGAEGITYTLYGPKGEVFNTPNPFVEFARRLDEGQIGVIKGWGGMHIACKLDVIPRMRKWYERPEKPFAVMARDIETAAKYAVVTKEGEALLRSPEVPIVLLPKKEAYDDPAVKAAVDMISPGLGNIGIFVPYSGAHHILFKHLQADALVMTSANPAGEPMLLGKNEAFNLKLDCYLLHNRRIINRVDDSLVIPYGGKGGALFIRRSRGLVPGAIDVPYKGTVVSVGAELNVTSAISRNGRLYTSQFIGNSTNYNVMQFLQGATEHLTHLLGVEAPDAVAMDMHPQYPTRRYGEGIARRHGLTPVEVQHHWAHGASLMVDLNKGPEDRMLVLAMDGAGYGPDKTIWGCELMMVSYKEYTRVGSLEGIPLIGGDKAVEDLRRLVFAVQERLGINSGMFTRDNAELMRKVMKNAIRCSSMGRLMDTISCRLDVCSKRTYEGEPAMKLEPLLLRGKPSFDFRTEIQNKDIPRVNTIILFEQLEQLLKRPQINDQVKADLARSFIHAVIKELVNMTVDAAAREGVKEVGLTGGVAYNIALNEMLRAELGAKGLTLVTHRRIPPGDGGISVGQNAIAGMALK